MSSISGIEGLRPTLKLLNIQKYSYCKQRSNYMWMEYY